jgi:hypothetical protein
MEKLVPKSHLPTLSRLAEIIRRQLVPDWGSGYQPAMRGTRSEAPRVSRASLITSEALGRTLHAHSGPEQAFTFLALYHPGLIGFNEQRVMWPDPAPHPLQSHPLMSCQVLPSSSGTVAIAAQLNVLHVHPKVWVPAPGSPEDPKEGYWVPSPWIGDHLLFLQDEQGPYCVYWDIKARAGEHGRPGPGRMQRRYSARAQARSAARLAVQECYYGEFGIRTVLAAGEQINRHVANNLRALFGWSLSPSPIPDSLRGELSERFREGLRKGTPPIEIIRTSVGTDLASVDIGKRILYQAISRRDVRVDLFQPVLIDRPLNPEVRDVIAEYAAWFAR